MKKIIFFILLLSSLRIAAQQDPLDSMKNLLKTNLSDSVRAGVLCNLSEYCDIQDILSYAEPGLELSKKINYRKGIAQASANIGFALAQMGEVSKAVDNFYVSLNMYLEIQDSIGIAQAYNNLGQMFSKEGSMKKALDFYLKSYAIQEKINDELGGATTLNNIGLIYSDQSDFAHSLEYSLKALKIFEKSGDQVKIAYVLNNIGADYIRMGKLRLAMNTYERSLLLSEKAGDVKGKGYSNCHIGEIYEKLEDLDAARNYYVKGLEQFKRIDDKEALAYGYYALGNLNFNEGKYTEAEKNAVEGLKYSQLLGYPKNIASNSGLLSKIYGAQKNFEKAYAMSLLFKQMSDSVSNAETRKTVLKTQMQIEFDKKESLQKAEQLKKDLLAEESNRTKTMILWSVVAGLFLVLLFSGIIFRSLRITRKQKITIEKQKVLVEEKQIEILGSIRYAKRIQSSILPTEKYIERNLTRLNKKI